MSHPEETSDVFGEDHWEWQYKAISSYKPLVSTKGWLKCGACNQYPRLWIFDNGRYARCLCSESKYSKPQAEAESVGDCIRRTGGFAEYDNTALQKSWNKYASTTTATKTKPAATPALGRLH